ncbi:hypothetical protein GC170_22650 [bacterium]|nr:hypothetical protein [bacterium]
MRQRSRRSTGGATALPEWRGERIGVLGGVREAILAVMCGVMPWWFGSADPPAIFVMSCLILALAAVTLIDSLGSGRRRGLTLIDTLTCLPVLALGLAALYGVLQWAELGPDLVGTLSPSRLALWKSWGGGETLVLKGDPGVTVPSAGARLAWLDAEVYESVVWVAALWALAVCVMRLPGRWGPLRRHSLVLSVSGTAMAIQSMLQALTWDGRVLWLRQKGVITISSGPFFVHSELAAYLNLCLGFLLARLAFGRILRETEIPGEEFLRSDGQAALGKGTLAIYPAGIGILAVLASGSRGGLLSMLLGMTVLGAIALRAKLRYATPRDEFTGGGGGQSGWFMVLGLLGVIVFGLTMLVDVFAIFGRVESIFSEGGSHAAGIRLAVWKLATETWKQAPVWGTGWGSFLWATQPVIEATGLGFVTHAESDYVQILPEGGLIGAGIALLGLFGLIRAGLVLAKSSERKLQLVLTGGALSGLAAVAWGALTENVLRTSGVIVPALVTAAHVVRLAVSMRRDKGEGAVGQDPGPAAERNVPFLRLGGVVLGAALTAATWPNVQSTQRMNRAWTAMERTGIQHAGVDFPNWGVVDMKDDRLERERSGTQAIEALLPGWGDYHLRRAVAEVETFQRRTLAELKREGVADAEARRLSRIMSVTVVIRELPAEEAAAASRELLGDPLVKAFLQPAAGSLAEAWRTQPSTAMVHLEMAILNWLYESGPTVERSLQRGIDLAGNQVGLLVRAGQIASALGDEPAALTAFGKALICRNAGEAEVRRIQPWLTADAVDRLTETSAEAAILAGEFLIDTADTARREAAGKRALAKLGEMENGDPARTNVLRARALWLTGEKDKAIDTVRVATAYAPQDKAPRVLLVEWLIAAGRTGKALDEARILTYFWPKDQDVAKLISKAAEADAIGGAGKGSESEKPVP